LVEPKPQKSQKTSKNHESFVNFVGGIIDGMNKLKGLC